MLAPATVQSVMGDLLEVLFEYRGSKREIIIESSHLCEDVARELETRHGISRPTVALTVTATGASSSSQSHGNTPERYFLQKWCSKWKKYIDVEHARDVKEGDRLTVVKICSNPPPPDDPDMRASVTPVSVSADQFSVIFFAGKPTIQ